jgi:hypothetical protein
VFEQSPGGTGPMYCNRREVLEAFGPHMTKTLFERLLRAEAWKLLPFEPGQQYRIERQSVREWAKGIGYDLGSWF